MEVRELVNVMRSTAGAGSVISERILTYADVCWQNVMGSTAGAGSGDFHQYRFARRKEQFRVARLDKEAKQQVWEEKNKTN